MPGDETAAREENLEISRSAPVKASSNRVFGWGAGFDLVGFDPFLGCLDGGWGGLEPT